MWREARHQVKLGKGVIRIRKVLIKGKELSGWLGIPRDWADEGGHFTPHPRATGIITCTGVLFRSPFRGQWVISQSILMLYFELLFNKCNLKNTFQSN